MTPWTRQTSSTPGKQPSVPDLVYDSKIETNFLGADIQHVYRVAGQSAETRLIRREERWVRQGYLDHGTSGILYLEKREEDGIGDVRVVKMVKKKAAVGQDREYVQEIEAIMKFSHPKYRHCFVSSNGWYEDEDSVFITMEYLELGDLERYLTQPFPEGQAKQITKQVLEGLNFMHENGFIHRDIKPANILVVSKSPNWFVKICDFGISKRQPEGTTTFLMLRGTCSFAAPEILGAISDNTYTFSVDMWSLGAVAYRILTNTNPFQTPHNLFDFANGITEFPEHDLKLQKVSEYGCDFIMKLLQPRPGARLSATLANLHPWMATLLDTEKTNTSKIPFSVTVKEPSKDAAVAITSKPRSCGNMTSALISQTVHSVSVSNYRPPSVSDCADESENDRRPKLPVDSSVTLEELKNDSSDEGKAVIKGGKLRQEPQFLGIKNSQVTNRDSRTLGHNEFQPTATKYTNEIQERNEKQNQPGQENNIFSNRNFSTLESNPRVNSDPTAALKCQTLDTIEDGLSSKNELIVKNNTLYAMTPETRPTEITPTRPASCKECRTIYEFPNGPIQRLPCQHFMCYFCILRHLALSLFSPKYMPPRCCDSPDGEIEPSYCGKFGIDPRIAAAWNRYRLLKASDNWTCPYGHPPECESLLATSGAPLTWQQVGNCSVCDTETWVPDGHNSGFKKLVRPISFCSLCSHRIESRECRKCDYHLAVWPFVKCVLQKTVLPNSELVAAFESACSTWSDVRPGNNPEYLALSALGTTPSPEKFVSDAAGFNTVSNHYEGLGPALNIPYLASPPSDNRNDFGEVDTTATCQPQGNNYNLWYSNQQPIPNQQVLGDNIFIPCASCSAPNLVPAILKVTGTVISCYYCKGITYLN